MNRTSLFVLLVLNGWAGPGWEQDHGKHGGISIVCSADWALIRRVEDDVSVQTAELTLKNMGGFAVQKLEYTLVAGGGTLFGRASAWDRVNGSEIGRGDAAAWSMSEHWRYNGPRIGHLEGDVQVRISGGAYLLDPDCAATAAGVVEYTSNVARPVSWTLA